MKLNYFNFKAFENKVLLTNDLGSYIFVSNDEFKKIIMKDIDLNSEFGSRLQEKNIIYEDTDLGYSDTLQYELRRLKSHVNIATSLHIFVVTTACNAACIYCQANNGIKKPALYMNKATAEKSVDIALQSPAKYLSFEFQGGEPLLNFEIIKHIVLYTESKKGKHEIRYNIVSNLTLLADEMLEFLSAYNFGVSTSVDGPEILHNYNRPFCEGEGTYNHTVQSIVKIKNYGLKVGAIQTTTKKSLSYPRELVHTYKELGFDSIFIRPLTPLGKAAVKWERIGYAPEEFIEFYINALEELILINKETYLREEHASILLSKIEGKFVNYMELRSPCGAAIGQLAYYPDGNIFTCDEGRMLFEMGESTFFLGNVYENKYTDLIKSSACRAVCASSVLETIPSCCDCVYQPYCGTCPVVNYAKSNDIIEKEPRGYRCRIYSRMLDYIFKKILQNDNETMKIFKSWSN